MRQILGFNTKWAFSKEATSVPAEMPKNWIWVNLPHTWNNIDGMDGGNDYYRGVCYYANTVDKIEFLPKADKYYLEFEGANSSATVYVNGKELAHHDGGYSTFRVNVTEEFKNAENPLVVVAVDNEANDTVYPQMADFTFYGGLYRDVKIICVNESHFDLDYYGAPGIKVTPKIEGKDAQVEVEVFTTDIKEGQKLVYSVKKACGCVIETKTVEANEAKVFFYFDVPNVGETVLEAIAGTCKDTSVIRKADTFNEAYRFKEKGAILNWFDVEMPEGYFSINDKISDIEATPEGKEFISNLMRGFMAQMMKNSDGGENSLSSMMAGEGVKQMMSGFSILRLTNMAGLMGLEFTKEQLLGMNAELNKIKKTN